MLRQGALASGLLCFPVLALCAGDAAINDINGRFSNTLTGDWSGLRSALAANGVTIGPEYTSNYQWLTSGKGDDGKEYGGKADLFVDIDSTGLGLWQGGGLHSHLEYRHGNAPANIGNTFFATNTAQLWPVSDEEEVVATSLYVSQALGSTGKVWLGKFNPIDLLAEDEFFGGWGTRRFMNMIFVAPPSGLIPAVFMGGYASGHFGSDTLSLMVFDPNDRTDDYFPDDLFSDGVNFSASYSHASTFQDRPALFTVTANYSTADGVDFSTLRPGITSTEKSGAYNVSFQVTHGLNGDSGNRPGSWKIHFKIASADGNPNYIDNSLVAGVTGNGGFLGRESDRLGVGVFSYQLSNELHGAFQRAEFGDESAIEIYYDAALTPWLTIGADAQYIGPALKGTDTSLVLAIRTNIRF